MRIASSLILPRFRYSRCYRSWIEREFNMIKGEPNGKISSDGHFFTAIGISYTNLYKDFFFPFGLGGWCFLHPPRAKERERERRGKAYPLTRALWSRAGLLIVDNDDDEASTRIASVLLRDSLYILPGGA